MVHLRYLGGILALIFFKYSSLIHMISPLKLLADICSRRPHWKHLFLDDFGGLLGLGGDVEGVEGGGWRGAGGFPLLILRPRKTPLSHVLRREGPSSDFDGLGQCWQFGDLHSSQIGVGGSAGFDVEGELDLRHNNPKGPHLPHRRPVLFFLFIFDVFVAGLGWFHLPITTRRVIQIRENKIPFEEVGLLRAEVVEVCRVVQVVGAVVVEGGLFSRKITRCWRFILAIQGWKVVHNGSFL